MELDETARRYFDLMLHNGRMPSVIVGGLLDGLRYFAQEIDGREYLISEIGLLEPSEVLPTR